MGRWFVFCAGVVAFTVVVASPSPAYEAGSLGSLTQNDYEIAAAVLKDVYPVGAKSPVMIATQVATFACNPPIDNGFSMGGCSGMRAASVEPEQLAVTLRAAMPAVTSELAENLVREGQLPATLTRTLPIRINQFLYGKGAPQSHPETPEMAFYMSRPAISAAGSKALVYVGIVSWKDQAQSQGRYFYLERSAHGWGVKDQVVIWRMGG